MDSRQNNIEWKVIPSTGGLYEASSDGEIRSIKRFTTNGRVLKQYINTHNGYAYVSISIANKKSTRRVHVLIAEAFLGPRRSGMQVNHIDGNKTNNRLDNLEYCTQSENMKHAFLTGLEIPKGTQVIDLDSLDVYKSAADAARSVGGVKGELVARVCRGVRSHYRGRHFAFYDEYLNNTVPAYAGKVRRKASISLWR